MQNVNELLQQDSLVQLIQPDQFVGWTYRIDYETAIVLTNDLWKSRARGVPHNCFLLATSIAPDKLAEIKEVVKETEPHEGQTMAFIDIMPRNTSKDFAAQDRRE